MYSILHLITLKPSMVSIATLLSALFTLSSCQVETFHSIDVQVPTPTYLSTDMTQLSSKQLVDVILTPFSLAALSVDMTLNPNHYTQPRGSARSRDLLIDTDQYYLKERHYCNSGGATDIVTDASTFLYDSGFMEVDLSFESASQQCRVIENGQLQTINSLLFYQVLGEQDTYLKRLHSLSASLTGDLEMSESNLYFEHAIAFIDIDYSSGTEVYMHGSSNALIKEPNRDSITAQLRTQGLYYDYSQGHPVAGNIELRSADTWVEFSFTHQGFWHRDSRGMYQFIEWSRLNY